MFTLLYLKLSSLYFYLVHHIVGWARIRVTAVLGLCLKLGLMLRLGFGLDLDLLWLELY